MKEMMIILLSITILVGILLIYMLYKNFKNVDKDEVLKTGVEIHKEALMGKLENLKKMVEQNDNDLLLKVITEEEHQEQLANYSKQIDEIEKELNEL